MMTSIVIAEVCDATMLIEVVKLTSKDFILNYQRGHSGKVAE